MAEIRFKQLRFLLKVAEEGSFTKAAKALAIAQPALSRQIAELEQSVGCRLLTRTARGAELTPEGVRFSEHARSILRQLEVARLDASNPDRIERGEVVVAATAAFSTFAAARLIKALANDYPGIRVTFNQLLAADAFEVMKKGHADLALVPNGHLIKGVDAEPCLIENLYFGGLISDELYGDNSIEMEEVCKYPLVLQTKKHFVRKTFEQAAFDAGYNLDIRYEQDTSRLFISYMEAGLGWGVGPWQAFYKLRSEGVFFARKIVNPELTRILTISRQENAPISKAAVIVQKYLRIIIRELFDEGVLRGELFPEEK